MVREVSLYEGPEHRLIAATDNWHSGEFEKYRGETVARIFDHTRSRAFEHLMDEVYDSGQERSMVLIGGYQFLAGRFSVFPRIRDGRVVGVGCVWTPLAQVMHMPHDRQQPRPGWALGDLHLRGPRQHATA